MTIGIAKGAIAASAISGNLPEKSLEFDGAADYLSMSNANFGSWDRTTWAFACEFYCTDLTGSRMIYGKNDPDEFEINVNSSAVSFNTRTDADGSINNAFVGPGSISEDTWYSVYMVYDSTQATAADRIYGYIDGVLSQGSGNDPTLDEPIRTKTGPVTIGAHGDGTRNFFPGLIYQPTFFSGTIPDVSEVIDGSGRLKDLSQLAGVKSLVDADDSAVTDLLLATDWTNNNSVTTSTTIPT